MNSFLLRKSCMACLICFSWIVCKIGGKWSYSCLTLFLEDFFQFFYTIHGRTTGQILPAYQQYQQKPLQLLSNDTKTIVCSPKVETDFFDSVPGVLQADIRRSFQWIIYLDSVPRTEIDLMKEMMIMSVYKYL